MKIDRHVCVQRGHIVTQSIRVFALDGVDFVTNFEFRVILQRFAYVVR